MTDTTSSPIRLYLMQIAANPTNHNPYVCYLVQTGDRKNILIDTGLPIDHELAAAGKNVIEQLAEIGLTPDDIHLLIATHFDLDHAGNLELFPKAEIIVQRTHYYAALTSQRLGRSRAHWDQPFLNYRFVAGDTILLPGLEVIETSGHVPGHQSVLIRLPETGTVILAIDAVTRQSLFTPDREAGPMDEDQELLRTSTRKLLDLAQHESAALVVFGHDADQWATLRKLPEYYG